MNVVDSSGWLEYLAEEPNADFFAPAIENTAAMSLPMADSVILATARGLGATLWTQDEHFKSVAGVRYVAKKK